jgi:hypothetical protein
MRHFLIAGVAIQLLALPAMAQTAPAPHTTPGINAPATTVTPTTPAVRSDSTTGTSSETHAAGGGLAGANSFTEAQARGRLEKDGYSNVSGMTKDKDGVWRGRASKGSTEHNVGVDYKGNIVTN